ncbi:P-loop containing nucleoside triphosphate hydrolase protein [Pelagophyceae sp. CCMP2097]|nr:P-loop containing nucleoside triphosphate hydrolase protein [Pelagophyceae sp. CCMP2097]
MAPSCSAFRFASLCLVAVAHGDVFDDRRALVRAALAAAGALAPLTDTGGVDHACSNPMRVGKDACACQIQCTDLQCSNALRLCQHDFGRWCSGIDTNTAKRVEKRIATLKMRGAPWSIDNASIAAFPPDTKYIAIIGEQKCGTTMAYDLLQKSSAVAPSANGRKEQHFYDSHHVVVGCRARAYVSGAAGGRAAGRYVLDATPDYLGDPIAAAHLGLMLPRAKLVALVREPVERAHAAWDQNRRAGSEARSFVHAISDELPTALRCAVVSDALATHFASVELLQRPNATRAHALVEYVERCLSFLGGRPRNCWVNHEYAQRPACKRYLQKGLYGDHLEMWAALFPPTQLGVLRSERLFGAEKADAVYSLFRFLGFGDAPRAGKEQTCWHDCATTKMEFTPLIVSRASKTSFTKSWRCPSCRLKCARKSSTSTRRRSAGSASSSPR